MSRDLLLFLEDIERSCAKIVRYAADLPRDVVLADEMRFDGILLNLHILGEAIKHLPEEFRRKYPGVSWRQIAGMRDFVAHAYFALDLDILWDAIQRDVPDLLNRVREIIAAERPGSAGGG